MGRTPFGPTCLVDRVLSRGEAAPRPYFMASEIVTGCTGAQMQRPSADGRSALARFQNPVRRINFPP